MNFDDKLCTEVAKLWVDSGGDAEGIYWNIQRLIDAVNAEILFRKGG